MQLELTSFVVLITLLMVLGDNSQEETQSHYCDMIQLYSATNGKAGWPAYNGTGSCTP